MSDLEAILKGIKLSRGKMIIVDGIFSMEGDMVKLPEIVKLGEMYKAAVMVDDAHALGVIGKDGAGTASHFNLTDKVQVIMGTFSKSLASIGGFIATNENTDDYLKHHAVPYIFSASLSPANTASALAALKLTIREPERRARLWKNTREMYKGLKDMGYNLGESEKPESPILPVLIGGGIERVFKACIYLQEEGVFVNPVVSPAVPVGKELLRISMMATHTDDHISYSLEKLKKVGGKIGVI